MMLSRSTSFPLSPEAIAPRIVAQWHSIRLTEFHNVRAARALIFLLINRFLTKLGTTASLDTPMQAHANYEKKLYWWPPPA